MRKIIQHIMIQRQYPSLFHKRVLNLQITMLCLVAQSCPTLCDPMDCSPPGSSVHGDSPGKNTGVGCHSLLQGIFPTQGSNPGLPHGRQILYRLNHQYQSRVDSLKSRQCDRVGNGMRKETLEPNGKTQYFGAISHSAKQPYTYPHPINIYSNFIIL